jgi:peroxiredoxin
MSLEKELEEMRKSSGYVFEEDMFTDSILHKGELTYPKTGDIAPAFVLPNEKGENVSLEGLLKQGPVIISFFKGNFCRFCDVELKALQRSLPQFEKYGAILLGISPHTVSVSFELKTEKNLSYTILSDRGNEIAEKYGLRFRMQDKLRNAFESFGLGDLTPLFGDSGENTNTMPIPGTFVIDMSGKVIFTFVDVDHTKRAEPSDIIASLMSIN